MTDQLTADIRTAVSALVRAGLAERGDSDNLARFVPGAWSVELVGGDLYVIRWANGETFTSIDSDTVAQAVGILRARRDAKRASLN